MSRGPMQLGEHNSALGKWRTAQRSADIRLRAYVHGFFASLSELPHLVTERHLPGVEVPLTLNFGSPHLHFYSSDKRPAALDGAWITGLHDRHHLAEAVGERHFMIVRFTPLGAHLFLGIPMHQLVNRAVDVADIDATLARVIADRVFLAGTWSERFTAMEALISERVSHKPLPPSVALVWNELMMNAGSVPLGRIASGVDCSHRNLIAQFRNCIGLTPKTVARLQRFSHTIALLNRCGSDAEPASKPYIEIDSTSRHRSAVRWADVAANGGYFDQSHLIKEFQQFAGTTPANVARQLSY